LLCEKELPGSIRARIGLHMQRATILDRLVVEVHLLQCLETAALVHERAVHWSYIVGGVTCINAGASGKIERRHTVGASDASTGGRTAVDVLLVAQFVIVVSGVIALPCEKWLQTLLTACVHRQKLLTIFSRKVTEQLRLRRCRDDHRRIWNVSGAG